MHNTGEAILLLKSDWSDVVCSFHGLSYRHTLKTLPCINLLELVFWGTGGRERQCNQVGLISCTYKAIIIYLSKPRNLIELTFLNVTKKYTFPMRLLRKILCKT